MNPHKETGEYQEAVALANRVLDRINTDPDDDLAILSRQFIRSTERLAQALKDAREEAYQAGIRRAKTLVEGQKETCGNCFPDNEEQERVECYGYTEQGNQFLDKALTALDAELHGNK